MSGKLINIKANDVSRRHSVRVPNKEQQYAAAVETLVTKLLGLKSSSTVTNLQVEKKTSSTAKDASVLAAHSKDTPESVKMVDLNLFLDAGLSVDDYSDFSSSGYPYKVWASIRNEESWMLEAMKWTTTGMVPLMLGMGVALSDDRTSGGIMYATAAFYALIAGGVWLWDSMDVDAVPANIESLKLEDY